MTVFAKSPMMMRREAEQRPNPAPKAPPPGLIDPARLPQLASETGAELEAASEWLAHLQAGRIAVNEGRRYKVEEVEGDPIPPLRRCHLR